MRDRHAVAVRHIQNPALGFARGEQRNRGEQRGQASESPPRASRDDNDSEQPEQERRHLPQPAIAGQRRRRAHEPPGLIPRVISEVDHRAGRRMARECRQDQPGRVIRAQVKAADERVCLGNQDKDIGYADEREKPDKPTPGHASSDSGEDRYEARRAPSCHSWHDARLYQPAGHRPTKRSSSV